MSRATIRAARAPARKIPDHLVTADRLAAADRAPGRAVVPQVAGLVAVVAAVVAAGLGAAVIEIGKGMR
jgi:hypothetical protein